MFPLGETFFLIFHIYHLSFWLVMFFGSKWSNCCHYLAEWKPLTATHKKKNWQYTFIKYERRFGFSERKNTLNFIYSSFSMKNKNIRNIIAFLSVVYHNKISKHWTIYEHWLFNVNRLLGRNIHFRDKIPDYLVRIKDNALFGLDFCSFQHAWSAPYFVITLIEYS